MSTIHRFRAVAKVRETQTTLLLTVCETVQAAMLAHASRFPAPDPTLAVFGAQVTALQTAQRAMGTGTAATAARNVARHALWLSLESERGYVQGIADTSAEDPVLVIKSAGFDVATVAARHKPVLAATQPGTPGVVQLVANATVLTGGSKKRPTFHWAYSIDGGHTWIEAPSTPGAETSLSGLPVMTTVSFRVAVTVGTKGTMEPWSQSVTLPVH